MADDGKGFWQSASGMLTGAAALIAAVTGLIVALKPIKPASAPSTELAIPTAATQAGPAPASHAKRPMMGPLQYGTRYEHNDINPITGVTLDSPEACSDLCYEKKDCKAMTYVVSRKTCWIKFAVGSRVETSDEVSAVKR